MVLLTYLRDTRGFREDKSTVLYTDILRKVIKCKHGLTGKECKF